jgi:arylsulfatase A-like enzyme
VKQAPSRYNASNAGRVNPYRVRHANMVTALDEAVGDVVAALKAAKMYEHTLVAWFSDK